MKTFLVEKAFKSHVGDLWIIHLRVGEKTLVYRVREDEYCAAGAPVAGDELFDEEYKALTARERTKKAYERAVKILASGDNTRRALKRKLVERGFDAEAAENAVARLCEEGYLREDEMLLRQFAVFEKRLWGPGKFMPALLAKGFSRDRIDEAMRKADEENIYRIEDVKEKLLERFAPKDHAEKRALFYKYGFRF